MTNQLKFINSTNLNHFKQAKFTMVMDDLLLVHGLKPNEAYVYSKLLDKLSLSAKNLDDFSDKLGVFVKYDQTKLGNDTNLSKGTVDNIMKKLKKQKLIWYYQEKRGLANKIYFVPLEIHNARSVQEDSSQEDTVNDIPENDGMSTGTNSELPSSTNSVPLELSSTNFSSSSSTNFVLEPDLSLKPDSRDIISKALIELSNNISQSINQINNRTNILEQQQAQILNALKTQILAELKSELQHQVVEEPKPRVSEGVSDALPKFNSMLEIYKEQVRYDDLMAEVGLGDRGLVDDLVITMATMYDQEDGIKSKGQHYQQAVVQSLLYRFTFDCAMDVIKNVKNYACGKPITDILGFLKSTILNECLTHNFSVEKEFLQEQQHDYTHDGNPSESLEPQSVPIDWESKLMEQY